MIRVLSVVRDFNLQLNVCHALFQHTRFVSEAGVCEPDVLWVGDSLIQNLVNSNIWARSFCQMHSLNFGIGGDRTEHVLWRLENGELEGLSPKVIIWC
jgi:platelet-activating factor acetylhydrolase IB subunit beta/gamma